MFKNYITPFERERLRVVLVNQKSLTAPESNTLGKVCVQHRLEGLAIDFNAVDAKEMLVVFLLITKLFIGELVLNGILLNQNTASNYTKKELDNMGKYLLIYSFERITVLYRFGQF